jgi:hypothetical protein
MAHRREAKAGLVEAAMAIAKARPLRRAMTAKVADSVALMVRRAAKVAQIAKVHQAHHAKAKPADVVLTVHPRAMAKARAVTRAALMVHPSATATAPVRHDVIATFGPMVRRGVKVPTHATTVPAALATKVVIAKPNVANAPARRAIATTIVARHAPSVTMTNPKKTRP